ncbi:MAG: nicotinate-nucleotide adenylyltransferase [Aestuariibacter sp.]
MSKATTSAPLLGIFGGTFDPVHNGHIKPLEAVQQQLELNRILALPCHIPPHKEAPSSSPKHRQAMLELEVKQHPWLTIDNREMQRNKPSYTLHTLQELRREYPEQHLCFIIGMDSMQAFDTWYQWQDIMQLCHLVVMQRGGYQPEFNATVKGLLDCAQVSQLDSLRKNKSGHVVFINTPQLDVSSSNIRQRIKNSESVDKLVSNEVIHYIEQHGLYL